MVQGTKHQKLRGKQKAVSKENWIVVKGTHEPIIEQDVWRKTQSLLAHRTRIMDCSKPSVNIFAGFLKCGDCGRAMAKEVWRLKDGTPRYQLNCGTSRRNGKAFCSPHSIPLRVLEHIVLDDLRAVIGSVKNIREIAERQWEGARKQILFADRQLERLHTDLNKAQGLKQSLYEDYKDGLITREEYTMFRGKYIEKESLLTEQIRDWEERRRQESKNDLFENPWLKRLIELKDIEKLDRGIVAEMIHEIRVYENLKILVQYNFSEELEHLFADAFIDEP